MVFRNFFISFLVVVFAVAPTAKAQTRIEAKNAGFVPASIWYSVDPFKEGDKIKIYTLVFNPEPRRFKGVVAFYDNTALLGKRNFSMQSTEAEIISIDWQVTAGGHKIFARIENPEFQTPNGDFEQVYLANDETERSERIIAKNLPSLDEVKEKLNEAVDSGLEPVKDLENKIAEKTPDYIANPVNKTVNAVEKLRQNTEELIVAKTQELKQSIKNNVNQNTSVDTISNGQSMDTETDISKSIDSADQPSVENPESSKSQQPQKLNQKTSQVITTVKTPLKYVGLFFLTILSYIFKYKILFYLSVFLLIYLIVRLIIRLLR